VALALTLRADMVKKKIVKRKIGILLETQTLMEMVYFF
jgi:hypothetical protein